MLSTNSEDTMTKRSIMLGGFTALAAAITLAGCSGGERAGLVDDHRKIEAMTDCVALQETFDRNTDAVERYSGGDPRREAPMAYATTAEKRLNEICY
jgi:hypothetical protein